MSQRFNNQNPYGPELGHNVGAKFDTMNIEGRNKNIPKNKGGLTVPLSGRNDCHDIYTGDLCFISPDGHFTSRNQPVIGTFNGTNFGKWENEQVAQRAFKFWGVAQYNAEYTKKGHFSVRTHGVTSHTWYGSGTIEAGDLISWEFVPYTRGKTNSITLASDIRSHKCKRQENTDRYLPVQKKYNPADSKLCLTRLGNMIANDRSDYNDLPMLNPTSQKMAGMEEIAANLKWGLAGVLKALQGQNIDLSDTKAVSRALGEIFKYYTSEERGQGPHRDLIENSLNLILCASNMHAENERKKIIGKNLETRSPGAKGTLILY